MNNLNKPKKSNKKGCAIFAVGAFAIFMLWVIIDNNNRQPITEADLTESTNTIPLKKRLQNNIDGFSKSSDTKAYKESIESLSIETGLFKAYGMILQEADSSKDVEVKELAEKLKGKVMAFQASELPAMRKAYGKFAAEKMWEHNVYVTTSGKNNSIITLTGGMFANNKNIKDTQQTLQEALSQFRFKQVRYQWYKDQDEYTYYDLETPNDKVIYN